MKRAAHIRIAEVLLLLTLAGASCNSSREYTKPNIIFFIADDMQTGRGMPIPELQQVGSWTKLLWGCLHVTPCRRGFGKPGWRDPVLKEHLMEKRCNQRNRFSLN